MRALLVPVGTDMYAIELDAVLEVLPSPAVTAIPTAPPVVLGAFNLRGDVVVILDSARLLGVATNAPVAAVVVVDAVSGVAGLSASGRTESVTLGEPVGPSSGMGTRGRFRVGDTVATLVDLPVLLESVRSAA